MPSALLHPDIRNSRVEKTSTEFFLLPLWEDPVASVTARSRAHHGKGKREEGKELAAGWLEGWKFIHLTCIALHLQGTDWGRGGGPVPARVRSVP